MSTLTAAGGCSAADDAEPPGGAADDAAAAGGDEADVEAEGAVPDFDEAPDAPEDIVEATATGKAKAMTIMSRRRMREFPFPETFCPPESHRAAKGAARVWSSGGKAG